MRKPPRIATWLLRRLGLDNRDESLVGDLVEEYGRGRSALWFWGQTFAAVLRAGRVPGIQELLREPSEALLSFAILFICAAPLTLEMALLTTVGDPVRPGVIPAEWAPGTAIAWFVIILVFLCLAMALNRFVWRKPRLARQMLAAASTVAATYCLVLAMTSLIAPATIVKPGDGYCIDLSCIGVQSANRADRGRDALVTVNVLIFSVAKSVTTSAKGASLYMLDEQGRRFPSAAPIDAVLTPGQSLNTSVAFVVPRDAQHLFLTEDLQANANDPWYTRLYLGADFSLFHKHWLLEVA